MCKAGGDKYAGRWGKYMQAGGDNFAISVVGVNLISVVGSNFWIKFAGRGIGKYAINIVTKMQTDEGEICIQMIFMHC